LSCVRVLKKKKTCYGKGRLKRLTNHNTLVVLLTNQSTFYFLQGEAS